MPDLILNLQRAAGNRATVSFLQGSVPEAHPVLKAPFTPAVRPVVQRSLVADLVDHTTGVAIAGEHHDEIERKEEKAVWKRFGIRVFYESDTITSNAGGSRPFVADRATPDPPILRAAYFWGHASVGLERFWTAVRNAEDFSILGVTMANHVETKERLQEELVEVGLGVSAELDETYDWLNKLAEGLPEDLEALTKLSPVARMRLAAIKLKQLEKISSLMHRVHQGGSYGHIASDAASLMKERSRQMIRRINSLASGLNRTIYKVGDIHVTDMRTLKLKPSAGVAVFSRDEYKKEIPSLDAKTRLAGAGNVLVSDAYRDENL